MILNIYQKNSILNRFERFSEDELPDKRHFYKSLKSKHISARDYLHAVKIWNNFEMKNMGHYHDLYLKTDVLLLADITRVLQTRSILLFQFSWIKLGCNVKND